MLSKKQYIYIYIRVDIVRVLPTLVTEPRKHATMTKAAEYLASKWISSTYMRINLPLHVSGFITGSHLEIVKVKDDLKGESFTTDFADATRTLRQSNRVAIL